MNQKTLIQVAVLLALLGAAAFLMRDKLGLISPRLARTVANATAPPAPSPTPAKVDAQGQPIAQEGPVPAQPPKEQLSPLSKDLKPLDSPPAFPSTKPPVVFVGPLKGANDQQTTVADVFDQMFRYQLRAAPKDKLPLNLVPYKHMTTVYHRTNSDSLFKQQKQETYVADAARLDADIAVTGVVDGAPGALPTVSLSFTDLHTSKSAQWSSQSPRPLGTITEILAEAARATAQFAKVSDADIDAAGITKGAAKQSTWEMATAPGESDELAIANAITADPDCVNLYELGWSRAEPTRYVDRGLKRWPDDNRLLRRKAEILWHQKASYPAFLINSELLRRYPDLFMVTNLIPELVEDALPPAPAGDATNAPKPMLVALNHMKNLAERYPLNWQVQWNYANILNRVAMYLRGDHTMDKIPADIRRKFSEMTDESARVIMNAARLRPDCSELLRALLYICFHAGQTDPMWQRTVIKSIHEVDPTNIEAEMYAAFSHSIGWGDHEDFWSFIEEALKNHPNDAKAMGRIAHTIGTELTRQMGWKAMTAEQVYKMPNKMSDQFIACTEFAMNNGEQVERWVAGMLREMYKQRYGEQKVVELVESGKHWALTAGAADDAQKKGEWERSLRLGRMAMPITENRETRERTQYNIVKSLWKLKRHDEAMAEASKGMVEFAEKQTFHYLFAVVADEKGGPLEEAYKAAYTSIDISTTNTGANETFERIRAKLNKPPHPKLK